MITSLITLLVIGQMVVGENLVNTEESAVAISPIGDRVLVVANYGVWAEYDLDGLDLTMAASGVFEPRTAECGSSWFADPGAVWEKTRGIRSKAFVSTLGASLSLNSCLGVFRGIPPRAEVVVATMTSPHFHDKPWLAVAGDDRLWLSTSRYGDPEGGRCVFTSSDRGRNWTNPCLRPANVGPSASGIASISADPPEAIVVWGTPIAYAMCTPDSCSGIRILHYYENAPPPIEPLRAPSLVQIESDDTRNEAVVVWAEKGDFGLGRAMSMRYRNGQWELPIPIGEGTTHQFMPAIGTTGDGKWVASVYEMDTFTSASLAIYIATSYEWSFLRRFSEENGYPVAIWPGEFLGDYHMTRCLPGKCVTAWTGTMPSDSQRMQIHVAAYDFGCSINPQRKGDDHASSSSVLLLGPALFVVLRRRTR